MNHKLKECFRQIHAEEELKNSTRAYLAQKTQGYTGLKTNRLPRYVYAAACACLLLMLSVGGQLYFSPTTTISIDINPSIELSVNRFDRVISVDSFNEDGNTLSEMRRIKFKDYSNAITQILGDSRIASLLSDDEIMTITVTGPDETQSSRILSDIEAYTETQKNTYCYFASAEELAAAHGSGLSYGKYRAFLELQSFAPDITPETIQGMTMREIRDLIDSLSSDSTEENTPPGGAPEKGQHGYGGGYGNGYGGGGNGYGYGRRRRAN